MKQKLLLVSAAMLMTSMGAFAAGWQKPTSGVDPESGKKYYIMNDEAKQFLTGTKVWFTWATTAGLADEGQVCTLTESEGVWTIARSDGKTTFCSGPTDGRGEMHVDGSGANVTKWVFSKQESGSYHISVDPNDARGYSNALYLAPLCWGWQGPDTANPNAIIANLDPTVEGNYCDWSFYSYDAQRAYELAPQVQTAIDSLKKIYPTVNVAAQEAVVANAEGDKTLAELQSADSIVAAEITLAAAINAAKEAYPSIDLADEEALLTVAEKTVASINAAIAKVAEKKEVVALAEVSVEKPADVSSKIVNGTFDVIGNFNGWSGTGWGAGGTKGPAAERWQVEFDTWQEVSDLADGVYAVNVDGFSRIGSLAADLAAFKAGERNIASLYAVNVEDSVVAEAPIMNIFGTLKPNDNTYGGDANEVGSDIYYTPNTMLMFTEFNTKGGYYKTNKVFIAVQGGKLKIGAKKAKKVDSSWVILDNFGLNYYGASAEAYQMLMNKNIENYPDYSEAVANAEILEAYANALTENATATNYAEFKANIKALNDALVPVEKNIAAWKTYTDALEDAKRVAADKTIQGEDRDILADYCELDAADILVALTLTEEEIAEEVTKLNKMKEDAINNGVSDGSDMTKYMTNAKFDNGTNGWNGGPTINQKCGEKYGCAAFDVWQEIKNAPVGMYEVAMQGFYREQRDDAAATNPTATSFPAGAAWSLFYDADGNPITPAPAPLAYVYMNSNKTPLKSVYEEQVPVGEVYVTIKTNEDGTTTTSLIGDARIDPNGQYWYPNTMATAAAAFASTNSEGNPRYQVSAFGLVARKGDSMRLGVKGDLKSGANWAIFDNFTLTYRGFRASLIKQEYDAAKESYSVPATLMGKDVREAAEEIITKFAGIADNDSMAQFEVLAAILDANEKMEESITLFKSLSDLLSDLESAITEYASTAEASAVTEAIALKQKYEDLSELKDEDVAGVKSDIELAVAKLQLPADYKEAADATPVDFTGLLKTPEFSDADGANSIAGWTCATAPNLGNDATQKAALAVEYYEKTYDMYQEIVGLPAGMYQVQVNACYRNGSTAEDFEANAAGTPTLAQMYASTSKDTIKVSVAHMASCAQAEKIGEGSEASFTNEDGETLWIPNDMVSAVSYFARGYYKNALNILVPEDGKLRIGMTQEKSVTYGWLLMDDWSLTYFGPNSKQTPGQVTSIEALEEVAPKAVEFYSVSGVKTAGLQKGINIVRKVDAKGAMKTYKVIVK